MDISPAARHYVRRLLVEHPAIRSYINRDTHPLGMKEEYLERYIHLEHLTYPQLNQLEFIIELHQKIRINEPHQTHQLQRLEQKIFDLLGIELPIAPHSYNTIENSPSSCDWLIKPQNDPSRHEAATLSEYYHYFV
ncbi:MAG: hypothetical protein ACK4HN_03550 [Thermosynechococcus sp.]|uniref:hypothetical protein n=1 Tax=Thermosynechococcus sp. TaxID=2814275 RepID=UPI00391B354D